MKKKEEKEQPISIKIQKNTIIGKKIIRISDKYNISFNAAFKIVIEDLMNKNPTNQNEQSVSQDNDQSENNSIKPIPIPEQKGLTRPIVENFVNKQEKTPSVQKQNDQDSIGEPLETESFLSAKDLAGLI